MDASPRKVEHAKAPDPAASADPAADLALVKRLRDKAHDKAIYNRRYWAEGINEAASFYEWEAADLIERLLRERDGLTAYLHERRAQCDILRAERAAALRERDEALASIRASDAANSIGGLVGASAHDLHLATEQRLAEQLVQCRAERDAALGERDELLRRLKEIGDV